jgi:uncharacterized membrane protein
MSKLRRACGPIFLGAGALHFLRPKVYEAIVPPYLPSKRAIVYASGAAEAVGGLGLMIPRTRRPASRLLVATLLAIFPANVEMARHPERFPMIPGGEKSLKARLPLQALFIVWVLAAARERPQTPQSETA